MALSAGLLAAELTTTPGKLQAFAAFCMAREQMTEEEEDRRIAALPDTVQDVIENAVMEELLDDDQPAVVVAIAFEANPDHLRSAGGRVHACVVRALV